MIKIDKEWLFETEANMDWQVGWMKFIQETENDLTQPQGFIYMHLIFHKHAVHSNLPNEMKVQICFPFN